MKLYFPFVLSLLWWHFVRLVLTGYVSKTSPVLYNCGTLANRKGSRRANVGRQFLKSCFNQAKKPQQFSHKQVAISMLAENNFILVDHIKNVEVLTPEVCTICDVTSVSHKFLILLNSILHNLLRPPPTIQKVFVSRNSISSFITFDYSTFWILI